MENWHGAAREKFHSIIHLHVPGARSLLSLSAIARECLLVSDKNLSVKDDAETSLQSSVLSDLECSRLGGVSSVNYFVGMEPAEHLELLLLSDFSGSNRT